MSAAPQHAKQFLLAKNGELLNLDYVVKFYEGQGVNAGKLFADLEQGAGIEIAGGTSMMHDMRKLLAINAGN